MQALPRTISNHRATRRSAPQEHMFDNEEYVFGFDGYYLEVDPRTSEHQSNGQRSRERNLTSNICCANRMREKANINVDRLHLSLQSSSVRVDGRQAIPNFRNHSLAIGTMVVDLAGHDRATNVHLHFAPSGFKLDSRLALRHAVRDSAPQLVSKGTSDRGTRPR